MAAGHRPASESAREIGPRLGLFGRTVGEFRHAMRVTAPALEGRFQEDVHEAFDLLPTREPLGDGEHVGVVVPARKFAGELIEDGRTAHAFDLIGRDRDADARTADDDAAIERAAGDGETDDETVIGIVDRRRIGGAEIVGLVAERAQQRDDVVFVSEPGMVRGEGDLHGEALFRTNGSAARKPENAGLMKIAASSASFAADLAAGALTHLEWLDLCAAELELDGVLLDLRHFPRRDDEYLAQVKKTSVDLGLTVAGVATEGVEDLAVALDAALRLGAPLVTLAASPASDDPDAWGAFSAALREALGTAKRLNVPLALRNAPETLCASGADLKRLAKDVDSSWLRFALAATELAAVDRSDALLTKTILGVCDVDDVAAFALPGDALAQTLVEGLRGFRGFVTIDRRDERGDRAAFHRALARLRTEFAREKV
jgi:sugar phosphate isomerase/epimerase